MSPRDDPDSSAQVQRARAGDITARQQLMLRQHNTLISLIRADLSAEIRACVEPEDVIQEVYSTILEKFDSFEGQDAGTFARWTQAIARNKVREHHRRNVSTRKPGASRQREPQAPFSQVSGTLARAIGEHLTRVSGQAARVEALDALAAALGLLPANYRQVIELRYLQGLSVQDTAEAVGKTKGAVLMTCQRALREMARTIGQFPLLTGS